MNTFKFPTSSAHLVCWSSSFSHPKSQHAKTIKSHSFNHEVELFVPTNERLELPSTTSFFYKVTCPLWRLLEPQFLDRYVRTGSLIGLSYNTRIDQTNSVCLLPTGDLMLVLDRDSYQQFGLSGTTSKFKGRKNERFNISIDISASSFRPGKKLYERVKWCLRDRIEDMTLMLVWAKDGECCDIEFPEDVKWEKISNGNSDYSFDNIKLPSFLDVGKSLDSDDMEELKESTFLELFDWFGLVACRAESALQSIDKPSPPFKSQFSCLNFPKDLQSNAVSKRWTGMIQTEEINSLLDKARELVDTGTAPWCVLSVWGFRDSPISWNRQEHDCSFSDTGDNDYVYFILPNSQYFLFVSAGSHDQIHQ